MSLRKWSGLSAVVMAAFAAGCNSAGGSADQLPTEPVSGTITMGGAPVPGATVTFSPVNTENPPAFGRTDNQGNFTLTTYEANDGAVAGDYKVLVSKSAPSAGGGGPDEQHDPTGETGREFSPAQHSGRGGGGGDTGGGSMLPEKFANASTTPIQKSVTDGENTFSIQL